MLSYYFYFINKLNNDFKNLEEYRMKSSNFWIRYLNALRD